MGEASLTLDVTGTGAANPSIGISEYNSVPVGFFPATNFLMSVGGIYSDSAHRFVTIDSSIDFSRLIESRPDPRWGPVKITKLAHAPAVPETSTCNPSGSDLAGNLGLQEVLAMGLIANAQNDIAIFPQGAAAVPAPPSPSATISGTFSDGLKGKFTGTISSPASSSSPNGATLGYTGGNVNIFGLTPTIPVSTIYPFGEISAQIDFTVVENVRDRFITVEVGLDGR